MLLFDDNEFILRMMSIMLLILLVITSDFIGSELSYPHEQPKKSLLRSSKLSSLTKRNNCVEIDAYVTTEFHHIYFGLFYSSNQRN